MVDILATPTVVRYRFTVEDYHRMGEAGILDEDDRVELIEGEILYMSPIGGKHAACVNESARLLIVRLNDRAVVSIQNPVRLSARSEPEPDLMLLRPRADRYREGLPVPEDVLLIIEVADSTLHFDRGTKLPLYAAAGIPEVWIVDLERRRVLVHRQPDGDLFREAFVIDQGSLSPSAFPDVALRVDEIFGKPR
ncbi:MAG: Uma2 family endonuclease [Dehalococcoidia bacterium]